MLTKDFSRALAVVGSRKADAYGRAAVRLLCEPIVRHGWTLVSGGAYGIDRQAHEVAIAHGGTTIAVLGSGLLRLYPAEHRQLFEGIVASGGMVISPFSLQTGPTASNFPARNRIIAGLSRACLVVQAAAQSGALITARFALDQGRDVAAVPGSITNPISAGCHSLIAQGATVASSADDLLNLLDSTAHQYQQVAVEQHDISHHQATLTSAAVDQTSKVAVAAQEMSDVVMDQQQISIEDHILLLCERPCSFDTLMEQVGVDRKTLSAHLLTMQLAGKIDQNSQGFWHR